jgi:hypothetical protein
MGDLPYLFEGALGCLALGFSLGRVQGSSPPFQQLHVTSIINNNFLPSVRRFLRLDDQNKLQTQTKLKITRKLKRTTKNKKSSHNAASTIIIIIITTTNLQPPLRILCLRTVLLPPLRRHRPNPSLLLNPNLALPPPHLARSPLDHPSQSSRCLPSHARGAAEI